jgi:heptosyltransferase-2
MKKILIIRFSSLGDIFLTYPVYRNIKQNERNYHITVLTKKQFAQIVKLNKYVDEVIEFENIYKTIIKINNANFDILIDLHSNLRSFIISLFSNIKKKIRYKKDSIYRRIFVNFKYISPRLEKHTIDRYLDTLKHLSIKRIDPYLYMDDIEEKEEIALKEKRILIAQTAFLGDSMLILPLIKILKKGNNHITLLTRAENAKLFDIKEIDSIIEDNKKNSSFYKEFLKLLKIIKTQNFDIAIVPHRSFRSAVLIFLSKIPVRIGFKTGLHSFLYNHRVPFNWNMHEVERNAMLLSALNIYQKPDFPELKTQNNEITEFLKSFKVKIAINPSSVWETKRWPKEYFSILIENLYKKYKEKIIIIGSKKEIEYNKSVTEKLNSESYLDLTGKTDLKELISIIKSLNLFITNDSGPMHIATACDIPIIAIFGPTTRHLGFFPYSKKAIVIEETLSCRPCKLHGSHKCPRKHFLCMKLITPDRVLKEAEKILKYQYE